RTRGGDNRQRLIARVLGDLGLTGARIAFDEPATVLELQANDLPDVQYVGDANTFREIRSVKTPEEVNLLRHAAKAVETALLGVVNLLDVGVTPRELLRYYRAAMAEQGGY